MIEGINLLLRGLKEVYPSLDITTEHLRQTPTRVARMFTELCSGLAQDPKMHLKTSFEETNCTGIVLVDRINFQSLCCHHLLTFRGIAHVAYIPNGRVVGLSKINRLVECLAARPQIQERLTYEIAHTLQDILQPKGVACVIEASHDCVETRGVRSKGSITKTSELTGIFLDNTKNCRDELMQLIK